jgi:hypothetical protein
MRATTLTQAGLLQQTAGGTFFAYCQCCAYMDHGDEVNCQLAESAPSEYEPAHEKTSFSNKLYTTCTHSLHKGHKIYA